MGEIVGRGDRVRGGVGVARVSGTQGRLVEGAVGPAWRPGSLLGRGPIGGVCFLFFFGLFSVFFSLYIFFSILFF